ncbi:hypothetical protein BDV3_005169 [Batrachochytrium dendrobatidis]
MSASVAAGNLQLALTSVETEIQTIQHDIELKLKQLPHIGPGCIHSLDPPSIHTSDPNSNCDCPLNLLARLERLDCLFKNMGVAKDKLVADKHKFALETESQLTRNAELLDLILAATEFEGDFQMLHTFNGLVKDLS